MAISDSSAERVAVLRALQLGDLLCAVPALRALRGALPKARITLIGLAWAREFAERFNRYVDDFLELPGFPGLPEREFDSAAFLDFLAAAHKRRFDLAIQLHGSGSFVNPLTAMLGARHNAGYFVPGDYCPDPQRFLPYPNHLPEVRRHLALMEFLGAPPLGEELDFPVREADRDALAELGDARRLRRGEYVCIHPGARYLSRRWGAERFAAVADRLDAMGLQVVITGSRSEAELADAVATAMRRPSINLAGRTTLGSLAALLDNARLVVSNDTGISHVATGVHVPSIVVVTGSDPKRWAPLDRRRHRIISHRVDCQPCEHVICPIGHPCATELSPERVFEAARELAADFADERLALDRNRTDLARPAAHELAAV
ncbi:MAG TPA: glycosyltransferase family 9 protein [Pirellulales bacterium]|nr:glycosyltransferase family 9 protein [Pirellulales bacterium]